MRIFLSEKRNQFFSFKKWLTDVAVNFKKIRYGLLKEYCGAVILKCCAMAQKWEIFLIFEIFCWKKKSTPVDYLVDHPNVPNF